MTDVLIWVCGVAFLYGALNILWFAYGPDEDAEEE